MTRHPLTDDQLDALAGALVPRLDAIADRNPYTTGDGRPYPPTPKPAVDTALRDALRALGPRPVVLTTPDRVEGVTEAVGRLPWDVIRPCIIETRPRTGLTSGIWLYTPLPESTKETP